MQIPLSSSHNDGIEMKSFSSRNSDHYDVGGGDSKFTIANTAPKTKTITTMAMSMPIPTTTTMNASKSSMSSMTSVDSSIPYTMLYDTPISYQQAQNIDQHTISYQPPLGSTINHSNNIVLTGGGNNPNYGATASSGGKMTDQVLPLPTGAGISSVIDSSKTSSSSTSSSSFTYSANKRQQSVSVRKIKNLYCVSFFSLSSIQSCDRL